MRYIKLVYIHLVTETFLNSEFLLLIMADQIRIPQSGGGIVRYMEDYQSKIEFGPIWVIVMIVLVILAEFAMHFLGKGILT